ncbi:MAG: hypothetical protein PVG65_06745 [Candidatus Thorarchaeota archaeon]
MIIEISIIVVIYAVWILTLVNAMISSEAVSLTIATIPFIISFPIALLLSAIIEISIPGFFIVNGVVTIVIGILIFVRWIMAIVGE